MESEFKFVEVKSEFEQNFCRLCFEKDSILVSLDSSRKNFKLRDLLKQISLVDFEVLESSKDPDEICGRCLDKIDNVIELIEMCKSSQKLFMESSVILSRDLIKLEPETFDCKIETEAEEAKIKSKKSKRKINRSKSSVKKVAQVKKKPEKQQLICHICGKHLQ